jgi:two-component system, NtrC family, C4-dicarboxylate transport response regulator DctD
MRTILLVDDDPLQALVRKSILEKRFSDVKRVADAAEALCLIEQRVFSDHLGLVISGHHAPGLGGPAFVAELHARMPEVPVLVLGGSAESPRDYEGDRVRFLAKPVATEQIVAAAGELLLKDNSNHTAA